MKKSIPLYLIVLILICISSHSFGQEKLTIKAGMGFPELTNIGALYEINKIQIGGSIGTSFTNSDDFLTISTDCYYYFGKDSKKYNRLTWYLKNGLTYFRVEDEYVVDNVVFLNSRVGRGINITQKLGIYVDLGLYFKLYEKENIKKSRNGWDFNINPVVFPSLSFSIFYKI